MENLQDGKATYRWMPPLIFTFILVSLRVHMAHMESTLFMDLLGQVLMRETDVNTYTSGKRGSTWLHIVHGNKYVFPSMEQAIIHSPV
jgi:hypothetical protein